MDLMVAGEVVGGDKWEALLFNSHSHVNWLLIPYLVVLQEVIDLGYR